MQIDNIVVQYRDRTKGSVSKLITYAEGVRVLGTIFWLYWDYRPLSFFGFWTLGFMLLAILFFIPIVVEYISTRVVLRFSTLIVCGFAMLAAIQSFFWGLILSNLAMKNRRDFEYRYTSVCENAEQKRKCSHFPETEDDNKWDEKLGTHISNLNKCVCALKIQ